MASIILAFAYGWTDTWRIRSACGVFAFGLLDHFPTNIFNNDYQVSRCTMSIMRALKDSLVKHPDAGFSLYFALYPPLSGNANFSWMSINGWPQNESVEWAEPIPVTLNGISSGDWAVSLRSFKIAETVEQPGGPVLRYLQNTEYIFNGAEGVEVVLDTGASTSWLPRNFLKHLICKVFPSAYNLKLDREIGDHDQDPEWGSTPLYRLDDNDNLNFNPTSCWVVLTFTGLQGTTVDVRVRVIDFLVAPRQRGHPRPSYKEGLIHAAPAQLNGRGLLGLNLFHASFVSLHKPAMGTPFVQIATRSRRNRNLELLPPIM
ncbi:hypothetical protein L226DRAFT_277913 [Lentinus tigrinus ALCF2SS1-7]|nr:hypothetical protein L226DRAFT_277913 [Lentinus tigrinus ALCF2SS1-7]